MSQFELVGDDAVDSMEGSDVSDSESEILTQIEGLKRSEESTKKHKAKTVRNTATGPKKKTTKKRSSVTKEARPASARSRSAAYTADEFLLVAKAFMRASCDAKHATDRKAEKFWDEVSTVYYHASIS